MSFSIETEEPATSGKRYRLRFLNGSQARTFILSLQNMTTPGTLPLWQIGSDGGFLATPANQNQILLMAAERADVIVDFTGLAAGTTLNLINTGPDAPYQGGVPGDGITPGTYVVANPATTGQVMQFKVVASDLTPDLTTNPSQMVLPTIVPLVPTVTTPVRKLSLNEVMSTVIDPVTLTSIGPVKALLGTATVLGGVVTAVLKAFMAPISELINLNDTETWEIYNFTADAHPIHLHLVEFQVVERQTFDSVTGLLGATVTAPTSGETGYKDTVMALPGQVTRIKAKCDKAGLYLWHCHILEYEENDMMRPFQVR